MSISYFLPMIIAFLVGVISAPFIIKKLRQLKMGQTEREEGVESHLKKAGTPTMGGIIILAAFLVGGLIFSGFDAKVIAVLILVVGFGAVGFYDDYLKVVLKRSDGLLPWQKLLLQVAITTVFLLVLVNCTDVGLSVILPFTGGKTADLGFFAYILLYLVVLATVNGVNFTDGLDGLASSVTVVVALFFVIAAFLMNTGMEILPCAMIGALLAFLIYNVFPAKVFMGDTGSLALGGFVAGMAYIMNMPIFILLFGLIYAVELVSVVLQVLYFKATHGKRIFKMTPIHHHFELCSWSEPKVVAVFTIITAVMCALSLVGLGL